MTLSFPTQIFPVYFNKFVVPGASMVVSTNMDWRKIYPETGNGLSSWVLRSMLIIKGDSRILIDTGFGNKQSFSFFRPFQLEREYQIDDQLAKIGLTKNDITDVILTHLHYDHCGGCLLKEGETIVPAFPKAQLWISSEQWKTALNPSETEKESFPEENIKPLPDFYPIRFIEEEGGYLPGIYFKIVNGHTRGQLIPLIRVNQDTILFGADLFPSSAHLDPDINMAYDMDQVLAKHEKEQVLSECIKNSYIIAFQHGSYIEACTVSNPKRKLEIHPVKFQQ